MTLLRKCCRTERYRDSKVENRKSFFEEEFSTRARLTAVIPSEARNLSLRPGGLRRNESEQDSSLRSVESHVIPAKAGIHPTWVPAYAGTTAFVTFISMGGPWAHAHLE